MIRTIRFALLAAAGLALCLPLAPTPAEAYSAYYCAPQRVSAAPQGRWVATTSSTTYTLNALGCAMIASADVGDAISAGFVPSSPYRAVTDRFSANGTLTLPAGAFIQQVILEEDSGAGILGGIRIGTLSGYQDVLLATTVGSNSMPTIEDASMGLRAFSRTTPQTLYVQASTSWNSARVNVTIVYGLF
jgi:uncharacterized membrane protein